MPRFHSGKRNGEGKETLGAGVADVLVNMGETALRVKSLKL